MSLAGWRSWPLKPSNGLGLRQDRGRTVHRAAFPDPTVAEEAAVGEKELLALGSIVAGRRVLGARHVRKAADREGNQGSVNQVHRFAHGGSPWVGDDVDQRGIATLDHGERPFERRPKLIRSNT